jgi:phosphocarrier protein
VTEAIVEIVNKRGLHARAAAKFVKIVATYNATVKVRKIDQDDVPAVSGSSILGLMMLGAEPGSKLHIVAEGKQADALVMALKTLLSNRFGEGE